MSVLKKILLGLAVLLALLILLGFLLPSSAHVERSTVIQAPPANVFALVNSFKGFNRWSPWAERDPETVYTFSGPDFGVGAAMSWVSQNPQVGAGSQKITLSEPYERIESHLDFGSQGTAQAFFALTPQAGGTEVRWGFDTEFGSNLVSRYMGLMFDRWIGADYEAGLANLKSLAEGLPQEDWTDMDIQIVELEPRWIVYTSASSPWEVAAIGQALGAAYGQIGAFMAANNLEMAGMPLAVTTESSDVEWKFDAGIPIAERSGLEIDPESPVQIRQIPGGRTVRGVSVGPYTALSESWDKVMAWTAAHGYEQAGLPWEEYVSDPGDTPEEELITHLHLTVK